MISYSYVIDRIRGMMNKFKSKIVTESKSSKVKSGKPVLVYRESYSCENEYEIRITNTIFMRSIASRYPVSL